MSAFLGKIHYWLYAKIQLHEKLIDHITAFAQKNGFACDKLLAESYSRYGHAAKGELEKQIDHGNIHGWLQNQIISVETRMAFIVTELLKSNAIHRDQVEEIFYQNAGDTRSKLEIHNASARDMYQLIFDHVLEGMPCDHVIEVIENNEAEITWRTTRDLHEDFWKQVGGDPQNHHRFRDAWIQGFVNFGDKRFHYTKSENNISKIERI